MVRVLRGRETNRDSVHGPPAGPHGCAPCAAGKGRCEPACTGAPLTESAGWGRRRHLPRCAHAQLRVVLNGAASFQTPGKPSFAARKRTGGRDAGPRLLTRPLRKRRRAVRAEGGASDAPSGRAAFNGFWTRFAKISTLVFLNHDVGVRGAHALGGQRGRE